MRPAHRHRLARGQSEVVGVALLVGVVAVVVLLVGALLIGNVTDQASGEPLVDLNESLSDTALTLIHGGGDSLADEEVTVILRQDGTDQRYDLASFTEGTGTDPSRFEPGERWVHPHSLSQGQARLLVVHAPSNTVVYDETITVPASKRPRARFGYTPGDPSPGQSVTFDATNATDADGSIDRYEWDFDGDGTTDATGQTTTHTYGSLGSYDVTLTVTDDTGENDTRTRTVTVTNEPPTASLSIQPDPSTTAKAVQLDASGSNDPDGNIVAYNYSLSDGRTIDGTSDTVPYTFDCAGTYDVTLTVTDDRGVSNTTTTTVSVTNATREPDAAINAGGEQVTSCEGVTYAADTGQYLAQGGGETGLGSASDVAGTPDDALYLTERWEGDSDLAYGFPFGNGTYRVTLKFAEIHFGTDGPGGADQRVFDVTVEGTLLEDDLDLYDRVGPNARFDVQHNASVTDGALNVTLGREVENPKVGAILVERLDEPPTAAASSSPTYPVPGETVTFDGSGSTDAEGPITSYEWDVTGDGTTDATGETATYSYGSAGTYTATLTVTDDAGYTDTTTVTVVVNEPPNASFTYSPTQPDQGEQVSFDGSGSSDPDGSITGYAWDFDGDGTTDATGQTATHTYASAGNHTATLTVTDDRGANNVTTRSVTVYGPPVASFTATRSGNQATLNASGSYDPDGGSLTTYRWDLNGDGFVDRYGEVITVDITDGTTPSDVTLQVVDDEGDTDTTTQTLPYTLDVSIPGFSGPAVVLALLVGGLLRRRGYL